MSEKLEVRGDVAQLIGGNVNEAPRQNNVVNFHMTGEKAAELMLTDLQRKRISTLVKELCAITQEKPLDVYRVILTDFGAERMKELPRAKYHDVVTQVERWIAENKQGSQNFEVALLAGEPKTMDGASVQHCSTCSEKENRYARLQIVSRGQWALSAFLAVTCGLLLYRMPAPVTSATAGENHCYYEGKPYSVGSTIKPAGTVAKECSSVTFDVSPTWIKQR